MNDDITWERLREVPLADMSPGDRWIVLEAFSAYTVDAQGRVKAFGWVGPRGQVWTLDSYDGVTLVGSQGDHTKSGVTGPDRKFLMVCPA